MSDSPVLDSIEAIDAHLAAAIERWERRRRGVRFVLCDSADRVQIHCPVDDLPANPDPVACRQAVEIFATALAQRAGDGSMLVVLTRPGSSAVSDPDRVWFHAAYDTCGRVGVRLLGVHLVTPTDRRPILLDDAL